MANKTVFILIISLLAIIPFISTEKKNEEPLVNMESKELISLTYRDFQNYKDQNESLFVMFYGPKCSHCHALEPMYKELAKQIVDDKFPFKICSIDAVHYQKVVKDEEIPIFPTFKVYYQGYTRYYDGGRTVIQIYDFLKRVVYGSIRNATTVDEVEKIIKESESTMLFKLDPEKDKDDYKVFADFAEAAEENVYVNCISEECNKKYPNKISFFRKFDEPMVVYNENDPIDRKHLRDFNNMYKYKLAGPIDEFYANEIFKFGVKTLLYFRDSNNKEQVEKDKVIQEVHKKWRGKLVTFALDLNSTQISKVFGKILKITENDYPKIAIIKPQKKMEDNFFYPGTTLEEITVEKVNQFVDNYFNGKLLKSEDEPKEQAPDFTIVVGKTFEREVINNDENVLVYFARGDHDDSRVKYGHAWMKGIEKLKNIPGLKLCGVDISKNDVERFMEKEAKYRIFLKGKKETPIVFIPKDKDAKEVPVYEFLDWVTDVLGIERIPEEHERKDTTTEKKEEAGKTDL